MAYYLQEKYINLLTSFGFQRVFGTESNKDLFIDFINSLLPTERHIWDATYKNYPMLAQTPIDDPGIFEIHCQGETGEAFIVELQKAQPNFFKDRSIYYGTVPMQKQVEKGNWRSGLSSIYTVGVLDFILDDRLEEETWLHRVQLKNQNGEVFSEKLQFVYLELPKFAKFLEQLETHLDKWLFLLKHLPELQEPPQALQGSIFSKLFEVAEIANFSPTEQERYRESLKYYRDLNAVMDTSRQEGREQGREEGRDEERSRLLQRQRALLQRQLSRQLGEIPEAARALIDRLSLESLEALGEELFEFSHLDELMAWLHEGRQRESAATDSTVVDLQPNLTRIVLSDRHRQR